jgi:membrane-associated phospholipid phosphatase
MTNNSTGNRRGWFWLLAGLAVVGLMFPLDDKVDGALLAANPSLAHDVAWWCSKIGEGWVIAVAGIVFAAVYFFANRPQVAISIFLVALTSLFTGLIATIFRVLIGRTRPSNHEVAQGFYGVWHDGHWIIGKSQFSSFPSGHAATAVGLAVAAWLVHRGWGVVAAVYALAVMWSRIALNCHHLSDVATSTVLSIAVVLLLKKRWPRLFASPPDVREKN